MSLWEATVFWPSMWAYENREQERQMREAEREQEKASLGRRP